MGVYTKTSMGIQRGVEAGIAGVLFAEALAGAGPVAAQKPGYNRSPEDPDHQIVAPESDSHSPRIEVRPDGKVYLVFPDKSSSPDSKSPGNTGQPPVIDNTEQLERNLIAQEEARKTAAPTGPDAGGGKPANPDMGGELLQQTEINLEPVRRVVLAPEDAQTLLIVKSEVSQDHPELKGLKSYALGFPLQVTNSEAGAQVSGLPTYNPNSDYGRAIEALGGFMVPGMSFGVLLSEKDGGRVEATPFLFVDTPDGVSDFGPHLRQGSFVTIDGQGEIRYWNFSGKPGFEVAFHQVDQSLLDFVAGYNVDGAKLAGLNLGDWVLVEQEAGKANPKIRAILAQKVEGQPQAISFDDDPSLYDKVPPTPGAPMIEARFAPVNPNAREALYTNTDIGLSIERQSASWQGVEGKLIPVVESVDVERVKAYDQNIMWLNLINNNPQYKNLGFEQFRTRLAKGEKFVFRTYAKDLDTKEVKLWEIPMDQVTFSYVLVNTENAPDHLSFAHMGDSKSDIYIDPKNPKHIIVFTGTSAKELKQTLGYPGFYSNATLGAIDLAMRTLAIPLTDQDKIYRGRVNTTGRLDSMGWDKGTPLYTLSDKILFGRKWSADGKKVESINPAVRFTTLGK